MLITLFQTVKNLALTKLEAVADDKFTIAKLKISVFHKEENIMGKGEHVDNSVPNGKDFGLDQIESTCRRQIQCC